MKRLQFICAIPAERGRMPVALVTLLQVFGLLALATIVRDQRPDPAVNLDAWQAMGLFVEFSSIAPLAVLFTVVAVVGLHALDAEMTEVARARECVVLLRWFAIVVVLLAVELASYGLWKGIWQMFAPMAALAFLDFALVFLVVRWLDSDDMDRTVKEAVRAHRPD